MKLRRLALTNFRCYRNLDLRLPDGPVIAVGANAQGKTSLLEAAYIAATTRSPQASAERELLRWGAGEDDGLFYGQIRAVVDREGADRTIDVVYSLAPEDAGAAPDDRRVSKTLRVDGNARRAMDVLGHFMVVLFAPRDLALVDGPPSERRRYLDVLLCQVDRGYCDALSRYNKVVVQRNHLLRQIRSGRSRVEELPFWDDRLIQDGSILLARRQAVTGRLQELAAAIHADLVGGGPALTLRYESTVPLDEIAESFQRALERSRREEIGRGVTVLGPHRDDLTFDVGGVSMRTYGSRGQQRSVALATKLAEAQLMCEIVGDEPVVLLDDVLSELDPHRRAFLLERIAHRRQTLLTTTDMDHVEPSFADRAQVLRVEAGTVAVVAPEGAPVS